MKILTTKAQLRYTLESGRRIIFEPGATITVIPLSPPPSGIPIDRDREHKNFRSGCERDLGTGGRDLAG